MVCQKLVSSKIINIYLQCYNILMIKLYNLNVMNSGYNDLIQYVRSWKMTKQFNLNKTYHIHL
jgi:hypothetical protein